VSQSITNPMVPVGAITLAWRCGAVFACLWPRPDPSVFGGWTECGIGNRKVQGHRQVQFFIPAAAISRRGE